MELMNGYNKVEKIIIASLIVASIGSMSVVAVWTIQNFIKIFG